MAAAQIAVIADAKQAVSALGDVGRSADTMSTHLTDASREASSAGERLDAIGGTASKAAGGFGDLGGALSALPGPLGALGTGMETAAPLIMGVTGAMDLLSLANIRGAASWVKNAAATVASRGVMLASAAATGVATAATWAMNIALSANPIGLIIIAVVALIAIIVLMVKNWDTVKKFMLAVWDAIKNAAAATWNAIKAAIMFVAEWAVKYIKFWISTILAIWDGIKALGTKVGEVVSTIVNWFKGLPAKVWGYITGFINKIKGIGKAIAQGIADGIDAGMAWIKEKIGNLGNLLPEWLSDILGISSPSRVFKSLGLQVMAGLAQGVDKGASRVEAAVSGVGNRMTKSLTVNPTFAEGLNGASASVVASRKGTSVHAEPVSQTTVNLHFHGIAADANQIYRALEQGFVELKRVRGRLEFQQ